MSSSIQRLILIFAVITLLFFFHTIIHIYFPTQSGKLGHDYSYFFPNILSGVYWYRSNGLLAIPWFTPAFCSGVPFFPNPQNLYYSIPQLFSFFLNPLHAVYFSVIGFAATGFVAMYVLLRRIFNLGILSSFLGATIFLFNEFYISRMLIGHLTYQVFTLIPLISIFLLSESKKRANNFISVICSACLFAYIFYAGAANFFIPVLLSVISIWLLKMLVIQSPKDDFWFKLTATGVLCLLISAAKLIPAIFFIQEIGNREFYPLPGFSSVWATILNVFHMLFFSYEKSISDAIVNYPYYLDQHEFEFGVSPVPLILIFILCFTQGLKFIKRGERPVLTRVPVFYSITLLLILLIPIAFNTFSPWWTEFLKSLPYVKSSSNLIRWVSIYIPIVVIVASISVNMIRIQSVKIFVVIISVLSISVLNYTADRNYYSQQSYDPGDILLAWESDTPPITYNYEIPGNVQRNDLLVIGGSQIQCYEPIFGYQLEMFNSGNLFQGSILEPIDDTLNFKNPACYVFPIENHCVAGDHFKLDDLDKLGSFSSYKPFEFHKPWYLDLLIFINILAVTIVLTVLVSYLISKLSVWIKYKSS